MEEHGCGKASEAAWFPLESDGAMGSFLHAPYIFTQENGEAQKKAQLLVAEPGPSGPLALGSTLWSTVGLARGELPEDPDGDSIKQ